MKSLVIIVIVMVLVASIEGRGLMSNDNDPSATNYDNCMMACEDTFNKCIKRSQENNDIAALISCQNDNKDCKGKCQSSLWNSKKVEETTF